VDKTGQKLSAPIRCAQINLEEALEGFQGSIVPFPLTYLGLPITLGRLKLTHLQQVFDQAAIKLGMAKWTAQHGWMQGASQNNYKRIAYLPIDCKQASQGVLQGNEQNS
jgi:hypothetical protein